MQPRTWTHYDSYESNVQLIRSYESYLHRNTFEGLTSRRPSSEMTDALVLSLRGGKTNQRGLIQYASFMRFKDVRVCPVFFLAL